MKIIIKDDFEYEVDIADTLRVIADSIDAGNHRGFYPCWEVINDDDLTA